MWFKLQVFRSQHLFKIIEEWVTVYATISTVIGKRILPSWLYHLLRWWKCLSSSSHNMSLQNFTKFLASDEVLLNKNRFEEAESPVIKLMFSLATNDASTARMHLAKRVTFDNWLSLRCHCKKRIDILFLSCCWLNKTNNLIVHNTLKIPHCRHL